MRTLLLSVLLFPLAMQGQQIVAEVGRVTTSFDYHDSNGERLDNLFPMAHVSFALGYRKNISTHLHLTGQLLFNEYGSEASIDGINARLMWNMEYLGAGLALDGEFFRRKGIVLLVRATAEPQLMLRGTQTINDRLYDMRGVEEFDKPFLFLRGGAGMNYCADERTVITIRYMYGLGQPMGASSGGERLRMRTSTFSLGLLWNLGRCTYCRSMRLRST